MRRNGRPARLLAWFPGLKVPDLHECKGQTSEPLLTRFSRMCCLGLIAWTAKPRSSNASTTGPCGSASFLGRYSPRDSTGFELRRVEGRPDPADHALLWSVQKRLHAIFVVEHANFVAEVGGNGSPWRNEPGCLGNVGST